MRDRLLFVPFMLMLILVLLSISTYSQEAQSEETLKQVPNGTDGLVLYKRDSTESTQIEKLPPAEYEGKHSSFKIGGGLIYDVTTYHQSDEFKAQMDSANLELDPQIKLRDFRILASGVFKTKRSLSFKFAYMWDGNNQEWLLRESGLTIGVPELFGHIFIGRTKEGFSMPKVMNGHSPWTNERQMAVDVVPILADGIKWMGFMPKSRIFWNLAAFNDALSKGQSFSTYKWQFTGRLGFMPMFDEENGKLVHIAANIRYGKPVNGKITLKSRPESNITPQIINTGEFASDYSTHIGGEIYYVNKSLMLGSEVVMHKFHTPESTSHTFIGGDVVISYFFTGARRPYKTAGSIFGFVPVRKPVFKGGIGEWEGVVRFSSFNLNDGTIKGGQFWRLTPMVNWYMTKVIRMEFIYGYGVLDRFGIEGAVQFFESRIQFTLM